MTHGGPVARYSFRSRDPAEVEAMMVAFGSSRLELGGTDDYQTNLEVADAGSFAVARAGGGVACAARHDPSPPDRLVISRVLTGRVGIAGRDADWRFAGSGLANVRPDVEFDVQTDDAATEEVRLEMRGLARVAESVTGLPCDSVRFDGGLPVSGRAASHWIAAVRHTRVDLLAHDDLMAHPLARAEGFRHLAVAALLAFPNTAMRALEVPGAVRGDDGLPGTVRRAMAYIETNAQRDIDLDDIARAARIGPRGLQALFRRYRDQSPSQYLRQVRMAGAHADLKRADPSAGETVAATAARWGFTHPGRFATQYRQTFGCAPRSTLQR